MSKITFVHAREILDSRGNPTVEVDLELEGGAFGRASVPAGASTGSYEAVELRDGGRRYGGKGVLLAVERVNATIAQAVKGKEFDQKSLDQKMKEMDDSANKQNLGANAILGVSLAFAKAEAARTKKQLFEYFNGLMPEGTRMILPIPMINIMNGGKHADRSADIQELMIVPHGFKSFSLALRAGSETFYALREILRGKSQSTAVGDEGGFAPALPSNEEALTLMVQAIEKAGYEKGKEISIAIDAAATSFLTGGLYRLARDGRNMDSRGMIAWYEELVNKYPIISIEDGLAEDDWDGWVELTTKLGGRVKLVGDDLFVTNIERLGEGVEKHAANAILIKLNQIGTVTETIGTLNMAKTAGYSAIVSHRSGETEDTTIADFAVGTGVGWIKTGSVSRTDRVAKYNQLLRIEETLGSKAFYAGNNQTMI